MLSQSEKDIGLKDLKELAINKQIDDISIQFKISTAEAKRLFYVALCRNVVSAEIFEMIGYILEDS